MTLEDLKLLYKPEHVNYMLDVLYSMPIDDLVMDLIDHMDKTEFDRWAEVLKEEFNDED